MSYSPPIGSSVNFEFPQRSYTAPSGANVDFVFGAFAERALVVSGGLEFFGGSDLKHGVTVNVVGGVQFVGVIHLLTDAPGVVSGQMKLTGRAEVNRGTALHISNRLTIHGHAKILSAQNVRIRGEIALRSGGAQVHAGTRVTAQGWLSLSGIFTCAVGRRIDVRGSIGKFSGVSSFTHGTSFDCAGDIQIYGTMGVSHVGSFAVIAAGSIEVSGGAAIELKRQFVHHSIYVLTTRQATEVINCGV